MSHTDDEVEVERIYNSALVIKWILTFLQRAYIPVKRKLFSPPSGRCQIRSAQGSISH